MDPGREAVDDGSVFRERRFGIAQRDEDGAEHHRRLFRQNRVRQLNRGLWIRLIVEHHELDLTSADSATLVDEILQNA
jgi:hypothetical protein